jgi:hypothetical protein
MVNTGGTERHPIATERLMEYWAHGEGAAKIRWNVPGDFDRCIMHVQEAVTKGGNAPLSDHVIKGLCSNLHVRATGARPGHAPGEEAIRKAEGK